MDFSFKVILHNLPFLLAAAKWTLLISVAGMAISIFLGIFICAARISRAAWLRRAAAVYISFFRGVPLLVQLLVFFYMLPHVGIDLPAMAAAILAVGMCSAAYTAEILRGALQAIPAGQTEAADALGMSPVWLWRRILVPQALRLGMPSLVNELILLVKVSSLASVVGIGELTRVAQNITGQTYRPLEVYIAAAAIYFLINLVISQLGRVAERRLQLN
ncbi:amino acid ABC transporter membrane protein 1 (PAAT family) [Hoeflea marina]|uniref:Glutamate/aspartate import permease protein GltK n=1 Tax=Hoeflea marina TaxID=274592 RepID=A0A317PL38_9HYPH|nr:amino acid ABC transporter permease [Hoeflea marina]PWW00498.1 amino acid ABC transporter membrane protein 1 (PAAT family) [Hoeflea marina]